LETTIINIIIGLEIDLFPKCFAQSIHSVGSGDGTTGIKFLKIEVDSVKSKLHP
jgi:hypothetical protein